MTGPHSSPWTAAIMLAGIRPRAGSNTRACVGVGYTSVSPRSAMRAATSGRTMDAVTNFETLPTGIGVSGRTYAASSTYGSRPAIGPSLQPGRSRAAGPSMRPKPRL